MPRSATSRLSDLLILAHAGDGKALDRVFTECRNYLEIHARALMESWLHAKCDASDLVQQTLLDAYRGFEGFRGGTEAEWLAWLRRILEHNAADLARCYAGTDKRQIRREIIWRASVDCPSSGIRGFDVMDLGESPSQELLRKERELLVADALARLDADHQEVIILRNLERLPFDQVAQRMGRSRPAVQMLWTRAIQKISKELAHQEQLVEE